MCDFGKYAMEVSKASPCSAGRADLLKFKCGRETLAVYCERHGKLVHYFVEHGRF